MKLVMAISKDGYVARGEHDTMQWTGSTDKALFKLVTLIGGGVVAAGCKTAAILPALEGRSVLALSRGGYTLHDFAEEYPEGVLIGGQTVALEALELGLIDEVILMRLERFAFSGIRDKITPTIIAGCFALTEVQILDVMVQLYRLKSRKPAVPPQFRLLP